MLYDRKNETPRALMSGAMRGASRRGRYAKRSITTPRTAHAAIAASAIRMSTTQIEIVGSIAPPKTVRTPKPTYAPTMNTSPCAKLRSFRIP